MFYPAHPGDGAFDAHAKTAVRNGAVAAEVEVPFERLAGQIVGGELFLHIFERRGTLAAADDLAVAFRGEQVDAEGAFGTLGVDLEIKTFDGGGKVVDKNRRAELG